MCWGGGSGNPPYKNLYKAHLDITWPALAHGSVNAESYDLQKNKNESVKLKSQNSSDEQ